MELELNRRTAFFVLSLELRLAVLLLACLVTAGHAGILEGYLGETRIVFYGLVVDQHGKPVEGATVLYEVENFSFFHAKYRTGSVKTGEDGRFRIRDGRGSSLDILDIRLEHCVFPMAGRTHDYEYRSYYTDCFKPDKNKPEVFTIRRKEKEAMYLYEKLYCHLEFPSLVEEKWRGFDLCAGDCKLPRSKNDPVYFFDLEFTWEHDAEKEEWTLHVKANGENAGFLLQNEMLYIAPENGYVKEKTFTFGYFKELPLKHVYLRLRDPGMYARLDITRAYANKNRIVIECNEYVNPYGSRCLEALDFDGKNQEMMNLYFTCEHDTEVSMREQRLVSPRPPFEEWIKEGKVTY